MTYARAMWRQDLHEEEAALSLSTAGPMAHRRGMSMASPIADTGMGTRSRQSPVVNAHDAALTEHEAVSNASLFDQCLYGALMVLVWDVRVWQNMVSAILENSHQTVSIQARLRYPGAKTSYTEIIILMCHLLTCRIRGVCAWPQVETSDVMVGVEDMFAMSLSDVIGKEQREELVSLGFSRYHFFR